MKVQPIRIDSELYAGITCFVLAGIFAATFLRDSYSKDVTSKGVAAADKLPGVSASELLNGRSNFLGSSAAPYTLVEFGDYQCPPCRAAQDKIYSVLSQYGNQVKVDFRNLPLTKIHPYAYPAAVIAESARGSNSFWKLHEHLFAADLSVPGTMTRLRQESKWLIGEELVSKQITDDTALAKRLEIHGTPTFLLCRKDGSVLQLHNLDLIGASLN